MPAILATAIGAALCIQPAWANGHGPVFGLATPTNGKGDWTLDFAPMFRGGAGGSTGMLRAMLTYGLTSNFQLSISGPLLLSTTPLPAARGTAMMPTSSDFEAIAGWRFQRHEPAVGTRLESTAYFGLDVPGPQPMAGLAGQQPRAPGVYTAVATGLASRVNYLWAGVGNTYYFPRSGSQRPDTLFYSLVYGYRPFTQQQKYPGVDYRFFAEMTGEHNSAVRMGGGAVPGTTGNQIFLGPSTLVLFKNYGIGAGVQWSVYRDGGQRFPREDYRAAVDLSYFF